MKILTSICTIFCGGFISIIASAQNSEFIKSNIYDFNHFAVEFQSGSNKTQFIRETGNVEFNDRLENIHLLTAGYQFNFGKHFGFQFNAGFGLQPKIYGFEKPQYLKSYFLLSTSIFREYSLAARVGLNGSYHHQFKDSKWGVDATIGGAVTVNTGGNGGVNASRFINGVVEDWYNLEYMNIGEPIGVLTTSFGVTRELENRNLLGLYLAGEYFFSSIIVGDYRFAPNPSTGRILNTGSNIGLKLKYSFTTAGRKDRIAGLVVEKNNTRIAKQAYKNEKRNTKTENMYLRAGTGIFNGRNITRGNLDQVRSSSNRGFRHFITFEKGLQKQYFYEGDLSVEEYYSSIEVTDVVKVTSNDFISSSASIGYGRRLIRKKTNWQFLTISAGVAVSYRMDFINAGAKNGTTHYPIPYEWTLESEGRIDESPTFFSLYTSLTHDIRLSDRIYLSLNYRFHQGLNTTVRETYRFTATPGPIEGDITRKINGTSNALNIGLKVRLPE
ncbi:MAG: hypothetical protein AB8B72_13880 [Crocinitomicaceae bacterium]